MTIPTQELPGRESAPVARKMIRRKHRNNDIVRTRTKILGTTPAIVLMALVMGVAFIQAIIVSLTSWRGIGTADFVGLENFTDAFGDDTMWLALLRTFVYAAVSSTGTVIVAIVLAAAVSANVRGSAWYRVIWFLPGIAPGAAVAIFWATTFQPFGAINSVAKLFGLPGESALLADPATAIIPVIVVTIWAGVGFAFLLILGSIEQISPSVYEAAKVDGASPLRQFFQITLPLARPVIVLTLMLNFIGAFNAAGFTIVWAMTRGGPGDATLTLPVLIYKTAFQNAQYGPASAMALIGSVVLIIVGVFALRMSRSSQ